MPTGDALPELRSANADMLRPVRCCASVIFLAVIALFALSQSGCNSGSRAVAPTITTQPASQVVTVGQTATFTVAATGTSPLTYQWQKNGSNISGANSASYTTPATAACDDGSTFQVIVSNTAGAVTSSAATLTVNTPPPPPPDSAGSVLTYHDDVARTGQNLNETTLTPANVNAASFGKIGFLNVQGKVDAEPLYVPNLTVGGASHNVVFVATEHDLVYAFDADNFAQLWQTSVLPSGETTSDNHGCDQITPEIGITSTPVIDLAAGTHGTIFVVASSKDTTGNYRQRLHALDLTTGAEQTGSPTTIQATFPNAQGQTTFAPGQYAERAGLLLLNGVLYMGWTSHCDESPYTGWVMGYSESTLQQVSVIDITPNGSDGSVWMAGAGLAADSSNFVYFLSANGTFDTTLNSSSFPVNGDFGNAFLKLSTNGSLSVADYFTMYNTAAESAADEDLGSGGALVIPDLKDASGNTVHLAVGAGKDANIYVVNRDSMGKFNPANDHAIYEEIDGALGGSIFGMPAYFNGTVYFGPVSATLKAFPFTTAQLAGTPSSHSAASFAYPGATPSVSANGSTNAIVWVVENSGGNGVLHAYDATNLATELYNSNQAAGGRDSFADNKFITPMIAHGKVYVGTPTGVAVFGLLH
jgi:hypothetical protein